MTDIYKKIVLGDNGSEEMLAITKESKNRLTGQQDWCISQEVGTTQWVWYRITPVEFDTYKAFGIKEIVYHDE